jgi:hypothetical protein
MNKDAPFIKRLAIAAMFMWMPAAIVAGVTVLTINFLR